MTGVSERRRRLMQVTELPWRARSSRWIGRAVASLGVHSTHVLSHPGVMSIAVGRLADPRRVGPQCIIAVLLVLLASDARAAFDPSDKGWEGCSSFSDLAKAELGSRRVRIISSLDYSMLEPRDAIVFLHPEVEIRFHPLAAFLAAGGRAAVVDDHGKAAGLLERFHIHRANAPSLPSLRLRDNSLLPIALPAPAESSASESNDHPTLRGVDQVVTNHPTALRLEPGIELTPLLVIPARGEPEALLAVTGVIGDARACGLTPAAPRDEPPEGHCGRLLAMGDPSAFINLMMRYPGNENFARGVFNYLLEDDTWGRRGGNLYILSGDFKQSGTYGDPGGLRESLGEQQAALLDWLEEVRSSGLPEPFSIALAAVAAICVAIWAGLAGGQLYAPLAPGYARALPHAAQGGFAGRVAVLAAKSTDRGLILRELKRNLESRLRQRLGLSGAVGPREIVQSAGERELLSPRSLRNLEQLLARLSAGEIAVMSARRLSISDRKLRALHQGVLEILTEMVELENPKRDSRSQHG
jgi:hypothetical protein